MFLIFLLTFQWLHRNNRTGLTPVSGILTPQKWRLWIQVEKVTKQHSYKHSSFQQHPSSGTLFTHAVTVRAGLVKSTKTPASFPPLQQGVYERTADGEYKPEMEQFSFSISANTAAPSPCSQLSLRSNMRTEVSTIRERALAPCNKKKTKHPPTNSSLTASLCPPSSRDCFYFSSP